MGILFHGKLSEATLTELKLAPRGAAPAKAAKAGKTAQVSAPAEPVARVSDGALQILAIMQRDARLIDFLMEDIAGYADDQIGAAVRELHDQCRDSIARYVALQPVIDGVEGTFTKAPTADPNSIKFIGNVPAKPPSGGILRHKGWRAAKVELPALGSRQDAAVIAPAEIEIE
jgi:hypothetical protein